MPTPNRTTRMISPTGRRVDVDGEDVASKVSSGWRVDPYPDNRERHRRSAIARFAGRPALVVGSGPSAGMHADAVRAFINREYPVVIGVNDAWRVLDGEPLPRCDYLVVLDEHYWTTHAERFRDFVASRPECVCCLGFTPSEDLEFFKAPLETDMPATEAPDYCPGQYFHGGSSGIVAAQLAMQAGCDPICFIGHDLTAEGGRTHGFGVRDQDELRGKYPQGREMIAGYRLLAEHARALGVRMINLSPIGIVDCFDRHPEILTSGVPMTRRPPNPSSNNQSRNPGGNAPPQATAGDTSAMSPRLDSPSIESTTSTEVVGTFSAAAPDTRSQAIQNAISRATGQSNIPLAGGLGGIHPDPEAESELAAEAAAAAADIAKEAGVFNPEALAALKETLEQPPLVLNPAAIQAPTGIPALPLAGSGVRGETVNHRRTPDASPTAASAAKPEDDSLAGDVGRMLSTAAAPPDPQSEAGFQFLAQMETQENFGITFVRMLRPDGHIRGVDTPHVLDKLREGYFFLSGQPCVPSRNGDPDAIPEGTTGGMPRVHEPFANRQSAMIYWIGELRKDIRIYGKTPGLDWSIALHLKNELDKYTRVATNQS